MVNPHGMYCVCLQQGVEAFQEEHLGVGANQVTQYACVDPSDHLVAVVHVAVGTVSVQGCFRKQRQVIGALAVSSPGVVPFARMGACVGSVAAEGDRPGVGVSEGNFADYREAD